jgi:hypothetical protein
MKRPKRKVGLGAPLDGLAGGIFAATVVPAGASGAVHPCPARRADQVITFDPGLPYHEALIQPAA